MREEGEKGEGKAEEEMEGCNFEEESIPPVIVLPLAESWTRQAGGSKGSDLPAGASAGLAHTSLACSSTP